MPRAFVSQIHAKKKKKEEKINTTKTNQTPFHKIELSGIPGQH